MHFQKYADISYRAFVFSNRQDDIVSRKTEILDSIYRYYNLDPASILFVGFNPAILKCRATTIYVTEIGEEVNDWLISQGVKFRYIPSESIGNLSVDCVIATDEYFTFASTDQEQRDLVDNICGLAEELVITTLRDYKNQDFKDREFSSPAIVRNEQDYRIYFEFNNVDLVDRNLSSRTVYEITPDDVQIHQCFACRNMYFKQLAKFSMDAGAREFLVHKNLMYKSLIKKNYEHVISIKFEQNGGHNQPT
jgi:hypothetical protein